MSTSTLGLFLRHLALSEEVNRLGTASDHNLLAAYEEVEHGQAAFTELMRRYGPMVLRTCRRVLGHGPDAEDAFQATFVLLARHACQLRREVTGPLSLGGWLHRVAYRTALKALSGEVRRRTYERQAGAMTHPHPDPLIEATWNEIRPILDAELDALPDEARRLLIACYLQGKTHAEAAAELKLPLGSLARHLERARALLAARLARRGITVSAVMLAVLLDELAHGAGVPAVLLVHTLEAATTFTEQSCGMVSANVARLVKGGLAQMTKSSTRFGILLTGWVGLLGAGLIACQTLKAWPDQTPKSAPSAAAERPVQEGDKAARTDCFGDPLPPGVLARMGTVRLFYGENNPIPSTPLAFSPDGKILASHIKGMTVALWDAATGKEIRRLTADAVKGGIGALGFSRDGKTLIAVSHWRDRKVCRWEVATGKLLRTLDDFQGRNEVYWSMALTSLPDGRTLAAGVFNNNVDGKKVLGAYIWDLATGKEVRLMAEPRKKESDSLLEALTFSPDGKRLAAAEQKNIYLWDVATGKEIHPLTHNADAPGERGVSGLAFSHDGKMLASIDGHTEGGIACVWDVASGKLLRRLTVPANSSAVALSPDGKTLVAGKESYLWEVSSGKEIRSLGLQDATVALFSPDGKTLAMGDRAGVIRLWNMASGKEIFPHPGHRQRIESVVYSPDGKTLASLGADHTTRLWDVATGKELRQLPKNTAPWNMSIAYSPDGKTLASIRKPIEGKVVHLWDTATGKEIRQFEAERWIVSVAFSPDGRLMAWSWNSVILWDVATGKQEVYKPAFKGQVNGVVFSPDGRLLAALGRDNTVSLLEVVTGNLVGQFGEAKPPGPQGGQTSVRFLAFSPNNRVVATSSTGDDKVRLWEVASGKQTGQLDVYKHCMKDKQMVPGQFSDWGGCVLAFSPDGRMLATAVPGVPISHRVDDLAVTLWEVASGQEIARLAGHRKAIWTLAFSPDGKTLTSGSDDLTCLVWDVMAVTGHLKPAATNALPPKSLSQEQLAAAWTDLASKDAAKAYQAISALCAAPEQVVPLLKQRIRPATAADPEQLTRWIADLDSERFAVRDKAQRAIEALGEPAIPALRRALANQPSLEVKRRLQNILAVIEPKVVAVDSPEQLRQKRAVQVLESIATPEARQVLQNLAQGVAEISLTREAQAALERLARRSASRP